MIWMARQEHAWNRYVPIDTRHCVHQFTEAKAKEHAAVAARDYIQERERKEPPAESEPARARTVCDPEPTLAH